MTKKNLVIKLLVNNYNIISSLRKVLFLTHKIKPKL